MDKNFADEINNLCLKFYEKNLPKTGKPIKNIEWTVLSCIVQKNSKNNLLEIISLGTGTKCLGSEQMSSKGDKLNDSHGEIMARRGFIRYLYYQLKNSTESSIFQFNLDKNKFQLKSEYSFHFFTTHSPCGDASIIIKNDYDDDGDDDDDDEQQPLNKKQKIEKSFTGAKLFDKNDGDLMSQDEGKIRTKPGRGIRTLSVSCSDKIAKWNILGIQGGLIMSLLDEPIYLESFIFASKTIYDIDVAERAFWKRFKLPEDFIVNDKFKINKIKILAAKNCNSFEYCKPTSEELKLRPCPTSIVWCKVDGKQLEISVNGKKQGVTKKNINTRDGRLKITKIEFLLSYIEILKLYPKLKNFNFPSELETYENWKKFSSINYYDYWNYLKCNYFRCWPIKSSSLLEFTN